MEKLRELQQRFNALVAQLRAAQAEESPDASKVTNIETEIRSLAGQIETEEAIVRTQEGIDPYAGHADRATPNEGSEEEIRSAVIAYMRTGDGSQLRAMTTGTTGGATGGYLVPESWENRIIEKEREHFVMRNLADVQTSATDRNIPVADDLGESGWIDQGGKYPESDAKFRKKQIESWKVGRICKVSEELLQDNTYNLEQWLINAFGYTNGLAMEKAYINGDGNKKPKGFLVDAESIEAAAAALAYDDVLKLFSALKTGYYPNAHWLMNINTLTAIMKLQDKSGAYLYKPFDPKTPTGFIGEILGRPVVFSSLMPDIKAGEKPVAFGDFKRYRIHDRKGFSIQRMDEKYADEGFVGFRGMQRTDGKLLISEAIQVLKFKGTPPAGD